MEMVSSFIADFIAGWVGGCFCLVVGYPFETVKVRQQNFATSLLVAIAETFKYEGILGFYKGMAAPLIAYGPSNSLFFGVYGVYMKFFNGTDSKSPSHVYRRERYFFNLFNAGCIAGLIQVAWMCPFELVKIAVQTSTEGQSFWVHNINLVQYRSTSDAFTKIFHLKGIRGLYRGFVAMCLRDVPTSGLYFVVYEGLLPNDRSKVQWYHKIWGGGWAGIVSISTVIPIDVVKTRIQADDILDPQYKGIMDCIKKINNVEGPRFFWKGLPIITARAFPAHAMLFIGYEMTIDVLSTRI